jgi:HSP20 family protein
MTQVKFNQRPSAHASNGVFDNLFNEFEQVLKHEFRNPGAFKPAANIVETEEAFHLELNAPGRNKNMFQLQVEQDVLTISYEQKAEENTNPLKYARKEFSLPSFNRNFHLSDKVDASAIEAKYEDGLLKVLLPKKVETKPLAKRIAVQ